MFALYIYVYVYVVITSAHRYSSTSRFLVYLMLLYAVEQRLVLFSWTRGFIPRWFAEITNTADSSSVILLSFPFPPSSSSTQNQILSSSLVLPFSYSSPPLLRSVSPCPSSRLPFSSYCPAPQSWRTLGCCCVTWVSCATDTTAVHSVSQQSKLAWVREPFWVSSICCLTRHNDTVNIRSSINSPTSRQNCMLNTVCGTWLHLNFTLSVISKMLTHQKRPPISIVHIFSYRSGVHWFIMA